MSRLLRGSLCAALLLAAPVSHAQDKKEATGKSHQDGPKVDPAKLTIVEGHVAFDPNGFLTIAGEVHNKTDTWIHNPRIEVTLLDAQGKAVGVDSIPVIVQKELGEQSPNDAVQASRTFVPPGEFAVFRYIRDAKKIQGAYAKHKLSASARSTTRKLGVTVEGLNTSKDKNGFYSASGKIKNAGTEECRSPTVVFGLYKADGKLFNVRTQSPDSHFQKMLQPGESVDFHYNAIENPGGNTIANVKAWADCVFRD
jgi:hypothetical protein